MSRIKIMIRRRNFGQIPYRNSRLLAAGVYPDFEPQSLEYQNIPELPELIPGL